VDQVAAGAAGPLATSGDGGGHGRHHPPTPWDELNRARYICWVCTAEPGDELPLRLHPWDTAPAPNATEEGSVTITIRENPGN